MNCVVYKEGMMIQLEVILCKVRRAQFDLPLTDKVGRAPRLMKKTTKCQKSNHMDTFHVKESQTLCKPRRIEQLSSVKNTTNFYTFYFCQMN